MLTKYLVAVQGGYNDMPYHNATHAADVTQTMNYFLSRGGLAAAAQLTKEMLLGSILAALVHDVGHIGVNNPFLISSGHELAIRYNDRSPMESMHCATAFELMRGEGCDVLQSLKHGQRRETRRCILDMVLATDNAMHTEYLAKFKTKVEQDEMDFDTTADQILTLQIALHAADVSNPAKPRAIYYAWKDRIVDEFYGQGDRERALGLPVTPFLDREKPIPEEKFQSGFIHGIVRPLYLAFAKLEGLELSLVTDTLEANLKVFTDIIAGQQPPAAPAPLAVAAAGAPAATGAPAASSPASLAAKGGARGSGRSNNGRGGDGDDDDEDDDGVSHIGELPRANSFGRQSPTHRQPGKMNALRTFSSFMGRGPKGGSADAAVVDTATRAKFLSKRSSGDGGELAQGGRLRGNSSGAS